MPASLRASFFVRSRGSAGAGNFRRSAALQDRGVDQAGLRAGKTRLRIEPIDKDGTEKESKTIRME